MDYQCEIIRHELLKGPYRRIVFTAPEIAKQAKPGQFVHVRIANLRDRILRRPFSICDVDPEAGTLTLVYKIVGQGTEELSRLQCGHSCSIMGPLGHGYTVVPQDTVPLILAGGYGSASTLLLAKTLPRKGVLMMGARGEEDLILMKEYRDLGYEVQIATNDGSVGKKGFVTELLPEVLKSLNGTPAMIYGCGPTPMLMALGKLSLDLGVRCELSLDHHMCCGVGACFACVIKMKDPSSSDGWRYSRTCKEGPVYGAEEVYYG